MLRLSFLLLGVLVLASCASQTKESGPSIYQQFVENNQLEALNKITAFKYQGWRSLDDEYLIINTSPTKRYLIALSSPCFELKHTQGIRINSKGMSTLYAGTDSISVPGFAASRCYIESIYKITESQADELSALRKNKDKQSAS